MSPRVAREILEFEKCQAQIVGTRSDISGKGEAVYLLGILTHGRDFGWQMAFPPNIFLSPNPEAKKIHISSIIRSREGFLLFVAVQALSIDDCAWLYCEPQYTSHVAHKYTLTSTPTRIHTKACDTWGDNARPRWENVKLAKDTVTTRGSWQHCRLQELRMLMPTSPSYRSNRSGLVLK